MIVVRDPGPLTTVQDLGRPGWAHLGVSRAGAVDAPALRAANRLVGNPSHAAGLETTLAGPELECTADTVVAVTGGRCAVTVDGEAVPFGAAVGVRAGQVLRLGAVERGVRSYLAVLGGLDVPPVLGSRSACTLSGLGPRPLRAGDRLPLGREVEAAVALPEVLPPIEAEPVLRLRFGPRVDAFAPDALDVLTSTRWLVTPSSDRTGVRLSDPPPAPPPPTLRRSSSSGGRARRVERNETKISAREGRGELLSEGVVPGAVQVPPDGRPIVFLANCPTTGGYPVIGVVAEEDLRHAAQARPGTGLRFTVG